MPTLQTGDFSLRALPQAPRLNPSDFRGGIPDLLAAFDQTSQIPARLEQVRSAQRKGRLEAATEPQRLELAKAQLAQDLELVPYLTAAQRERAIRALDEPGGTDLYEAPGVGLVQAETTVRRDPVTGETRDIVNPVVKKTAGQVADERTTAGALAQKRVAEADAAGARTETQRFDAETRRMKAEVDRLKIQNALANKRSFRMFKNTGFGGKTTGFVATVFDPITGEFINQELDATGKPIGEAYRSKAEPQGDLVQDTTQQGGLDFSFTVPDQPATNHALPTPVAPQAGSPPTPVPVAPAAPVAPQANLPILTPQQAQAATTPPGRFTGTNGLTYEKTADGRIVRVQ